MFEEIHLLREWIGAVPLEVPLYPLWGSLVRAFAQMGVDAVVAAKGLSVCAYVANAALLFVTIYRFAAYAVRRAEAAAFFDDANYNGLEWVVAGIGSMTYLLTPGFVAAAVAPTPLLFAQLAPLCALFALSGLIRSTRLGTFVGCVFSAGFFMGCAILSGPIGILPLPIVLVALVFPFLKRRNLIATSFALMLVGVVFALALLSLVVFDSPIADLLRVIGVTAHMIPQGFVYPGSVVFAVFGVFSSFFAVFLIGSGRIRPIRLRITFFIFWGVAAFFLGVGTIIWAVRDSRCPADHFVAGILEELGSRKVIVSDGLFDDLLAVAVPEDVTILRLGGDVTVPDEILEMVPDENIRFAADMGSLAFVTDWLKHDPEAASRVLLVSTRRFETESPLALEPRGWCWVTAEEDAPKTPQALGALWEERWKTVSADVAGLDLASWTMRRIFAIQGMALVDRLESAGFPRDAQHIRGIVVSQIDPSFSREAVKRRDLDRERVLQAARSLGEMDLVRLEETILPELERTITHEVSWLLHMLKGEVALRKGSEYHVEARDEYRIATLDEFSDINATAPKLLLLDASLRDDPSLERDSLEVLRRDRSNRMALAILGNSFAQRGENQKAEAYLRRATAEGDGPVMVEPLNDLAEVLSRLNRPEEALELSDRVLAFRPESWNFLETRASILMRLGRLDEAERMLADVARLAREAKESDIARNILDIDQARLMKLRHRTGGEYLRLVRNLKTRNLTTAQRRLVEEL